MKELNRFRQFLNENEVLDRYDKASKKLFDMTWDEVQRENDPRMKQDVHDEVQKDDDLDYIDDVQENQSSPQELNTFRKFLNENEDDGYDRASRKLFDMTWDEVRRENDPRMRQAVHDEVQKDDDTNYIDDVQESRDFAPEFYEVTYTTLDGNLVERDFKHFTDKGEAIAFHNSLKDNDEIALAIIDKVYYDPNSFLSGRSEQAYYSNPIHQSFLNSRLDDKRFQGSESFNQFLDRKLKGRNEVGTSLALNEFDDKSMEDYGDAMKVALGSKKMGSSDDEAKKRFARLTPEEQASLLKMLAYTDDRMSIMDKATSLEENMPKAAIMRQIRDAEEILDSGEADGMPLDNETEMLVRQELKRLKQMAGGDKKEKTMKFLKSKKSYRENLNLEEIYKDIMEVDEEEEKIRKKYDSMKRPSQDEVNDAFEKFNREAHYLNNKPVSKWDAADMSNWKSILSKGGKIK